MIKVSTTGMAVSLKTDLRFPISGQWGHGDRIIHFLRNTTVRHDVMLREAQYSKLDDFSILGHNSDLLIMNLHHRVHIFIIRIWEKNDSKKQYLIKSSVNILAL